MSGKKLHLKYLDATRIGKQRRILMELNAYFTILQYILMGATAIAILLIFLYVYHSKENEEKENTE
jgi:flagellar basal body-associated protein FliL